MTNLKIKIAAVLFSMVGVFALGIEKTQAYFETVPTCQTANPNQNPGIPGVTTECTLPAQAICCDKLDGQRFFRSAL